MTRKLCPHCGQLMAEKLPPLKQRIYDALLERPRSAEELRQIVGSYHPRPDNPVTDWTIYVHVHQLRRLIARKGLTVKKARSKPYRLVPL